MAEHAIPTLSPCVKYHLGTTQFHAFFYGVMPARLGATLPQDAWVRGAVGEEKRTEVRLREVSLPFSAPSSAKGGSAGAQPTRNPRNPGTQAPSKRGVRGSG
jgi:hypothetical protein